MRGEGRTDEELADYVLRPFEAEEEETADALVEIGADAVESMLTEGLVVTMNRFNARNVAPIDEEPSEP